MKKNLFVIILSSLLIASCVSCSDDNTVPSKEESQITESSEVIEESSEESSEIIEESSEEISQEESIDMNERVPIPESMTVFTNQNFNNNGKKMGDNDGPAYCVYGKKGYNKASMDVLISQMRINTIREDGRYLNGYIFLGADVYTNDNYWCNCFDTGFCWSGDDPAWHLFYNIYQPANEGASGWYESKVRLDPTHDFRLVLDTSEKDESATIYIYDLTSDKLVDKKTFGVKNLKCNGSNTAYLMDIALDYPGNVKKDTSGNDSDDWKEITLYNSDENLFMRNVLVENVKIWKSGTEKVWEKSDTDHIALWPDSTMPEVDYPCTFLAFEDENNRDSKYRVDLDMNR